MTDTNNETPQRSKYMAHIPPWLCDVVRICSRSLSARADQLRAQPFVLDSSAHIKEWAALDIPRKLAAKWRHLHLLVLLWDREHLRIAAPLEEAVEGPTNHAERE